MISLWKKNKLFYSLFILISISIIFVFMYISRNLSFISDDWCFAVYNIKESLILTLNIFNHKNIIPHGYGYIGLLLYRLFYFKIPIMIGIHPFDFVEYNAVIKGIFTILTLCCVSKFSVINYKNKNIYIICYLLSAVCFFCWGAIYQYILFVGYAFYRYFFSILFFSIFIDYLYKYFTYRDLKKITKKDCFIALLCGYTVGTSSEIVFFTGALFVVFLIIYNKIFTKKNIFYSKFIIPVLGLFTAIYFFTTNNAFKSLLMVRGFDRINITIQSLKEFLAIYYDFYFLKDIIWWIIFIGLIIVCTYWAIKQKEIEKIIFPIFLKVSFLIVIFSLILCGKTGYNNNFWLTLDDILFLSKMFNLIIIYILISYFVKNVVKVCRNKEDKKKFITILLICITTVSIVMPVIYKKKNIYINIYKELLTIKIMQYKFEKIMRYNYLQGKVPYFPMQYKSYNYFWLLCEFLNNSDYKDYPYESYFYTSVYYPSLYNTEISKILVFKFSDDAMEQFFKDGGKFTMEELKDLKYTKLLDDNFVLNKVTE